MNMQFQGETAKPETLDEHLRGAAITYLTRVLGLTGRKMTAAAMVARRNRTEFYRLLKRVGVDSRSFEKRDGRVDVGQIRDAVDGSFADAEERATVEYITAALRWTRGDVTAVARVAGRNRTGFYWLLYRLNINPKAFREKPKTCSWISPVP